MKFKITMKDPDGYSDSVQEAVRDSLKDSGLDEDELELVEEKRREKFSEVLSKWFEYGEYLTVEVDLEKKTIRVVEQE